MDSDGWLHCLPQINVYFLKKNLYTLLGPFGWLQSKFFQKTLILAFYGKNSAFFQKLSKNFRVLAHCALSDIQWLFVVG